MIARARLSATVLLACAGSVACGGAQSLTNRPLEQRAAAAAPAHHVDSLPLLTANPLTTALAAGIVPLLPELEAVYKDLHQHDPATADDRVAANLSDGSEGSSSDSLTGNAMSATTPPSPTNPYVEAISARC